MKLKILPLVKTDPRFVITLYYMMGVDGDTLSYSISFNDLSENLIKLIRILIKVGEYIPEGFLGFGFDIETLDYAHDDDILTLDEVNFLYNTPKDISSLIQCMCNKEFLYYKRFDITYIDKNGDSHLVEIIE